MCTVKKFTWPLSKNKKPASSPERYKPFSKNACVLSAGMLLTSLSLTALGINYFYFQYPGNNYYPPDAATIGLLLLLIYAGCVLQFGRRQRISLIIKEVFYYYLVLALLILASNAVQYTPFHPIDHYIVKFEAFFGIDMGGITRWTRAHPTIDGLLEYPYYSLNYQITLIPLVLIAAKRYALVQEYYFFLLASAVIGYSFYYFFPTIAPAGVFKIPFFYEYQKATALKFYQIHHYIQPTTQEGGMIATPSFHAIWAWFSLYLLRPWPLLFVPIALLNCLLLMACVLLGWHYPTDLAASLLVIIITHLLYKTCCRRTAI